jgi:glycosyltransferase involved in cell wall biosynthesis
MPELFDADPDHAPENSISYVHFEAIYFASQALKRSAVAAGFRVGHAEVVYPGIAAQTFVHEVKPASAPVKKVLLSTRLSPENGVMTALEAFRLLQGEFRDCSLHIYGRGESDYVAQLRSFVIAQQLPVEFHTVSDLAKDMAAIYRQHDAFLHTVEWDEPFAAAPLEAMASGLPVISSGIGGTGEWFRNGQNALTYTPGDPMTLAGAIRELVRHGELRQNIAEAGQADVMTRLNEAAVMDKIEDVLQQALELSALT